MAHPRHDRDQLVFFILLRATIWSHYEHFRFVIESMATIKFCAGTGNV